MCSTSLTVVVRLRSKVVVMREESSSGESPLYVQTTAMTGMSIFGKMSTGVRNITTGPRMNSKSDKTTNVYGRLRARRTIHIDEFPYCLGVNQLRVRDAAISHSLLKQFCEKASR